MHTARVLLYLIAIVLLFVAAFAPAFGANPRVSLALLAAAFALLAYALPVIAAG